MAAAISLVESQAVAVLGLRTSELGEMVEASETRMAIEAEEEEIPFSISIAEPGPVESDGRASALVSDLGLSGSNQRSGSDLAREILAQFCSSHHPITLLALSERMSESRGRVSTVVDRMRAAAIVERAPMVDRISQDVFAGLLRQYDARGEEWLMTRGGLGRLDEGVSKALIEGTRNGSLEIEGLRVLLTPVPLEDQRVLLNTLGGRMPYGFRIAGEDGKSLSNRVMRRAERTLRRLRTVADRLDATIS